MRSVIALATIVGLAVFLSSAAGLPAEHASADRAILTKRQGSSVPTPMGPPVTAASTPAVLRAAPAPGPPREPSSPRPNSNPPTIPVPEPGGRSPRPNPVPPTRDPVVNPSPRPNPSPPARRPILNPSPRPSPTPPSRGPDFVPTPPQFGRGFDNRYVQWYGRAGYFDSRYNLPLVRYNNQIGFWNYGTFVSVDVDETYLHLWEEQPFPDLSSVGRPIYVIGNIRIYGIMGRFFFWTNRTAGWLPLRWQFTDGLPQWVLNLA